MLESRMRLLLTSTVTCQGANGEGSKCELLIISSKLDACSVKNARQLRLNTKYQEPKPVPWKLSRPRRKCHALIIQGIPCLALLVSAPRLSLCGLY